MADYVTKVRTSTGDKQIDYNALANLPTIPEDALAILDPDGKVRAVGGITNYLTSKYSNAEVTQY